MFQKSLHILMALFVISAGVNAGELAPLDPHPPAVNRVLEERAFTLPFRFAFDLPVPQPSSLDALQWQTPVKSQGHRGTCSIFSTTAELEALLKYHHQKEVTLSENYLEYLVMARMKSSATEGSDVPWNVPAFQRYGTIEESVWPYEELDWTATDLPESEQRKVNETCARLSGNRLQACLLGHMSPTQDKYATQAAEFAAKWETNGLSYQQLSTQRGIKDLLRQGYPLVLSVEFFYGAWNHRLMVDYGLGDRNMDLWSAGVVSAPTSRDINVSRQHPAGHSFVIVGFDDAKRVYYFKNSWGTSQFGVTNHLKGEDSLPGYGSIAYEYAHNYGTFFDVYFADRDGRPKR